MMESLRELWTCCAEKRVDLKPINDRIRHYVAILCTSVLIRTPISANMVTILFLLFGSVGGVLLSFPGYWSPLAGALCLQVHAVLDIVDGQVARFRRSHDTSPGSPKLGMYLDLNGHVITDTMIFMGLTISCYDSISQSKWVVILGFLGTGARLLYLLIGCIVVYVVATEIPRDSPLRAAELPCTKDLRKDLAPIDHQAGSFAKIKKLVVEIFFFVRWPHYLDFILILSLVGCIPYALPILAPGVFFFTAGTILVVSRHRILQSHPEKEAHP